MLALEMNLLLVVLLMKLYISNGDMSNIKDYKLPTVGISVLVRNKAHTLPYFLTCLNNLDYPKDRLFLWIYSDFNEDNSIEIINEWVEKHSSEFKKLFITTNSSSGIRHSDETKTVQWTPEHFKHIINLRQKALEFSRQMWADYLFMIDADVFLTNPLTLRNLILKEMDVVAPMLISDGLYSNFWCGMTEKFYYKRTDDYKLIQKRDNVGCFNVPMVHTAVLINMRTLVSDSLTYDPKKIRNYNGPEDDIIAFALNAKQNGIELMICNDEIYGYILIPLEENEELKIDYEQLLNVKLLAISQGNPLPLESYMQADMLYPEPWKFGCNEIYMINLERRIERRKLMEMSFKELGMDVTYFAAVDGKTLDMENLKDRSITLMPNYEDPYHKRPMKAGEVGCFLSHYYIWKKIVEEHTPITLILEDDIRFVSYFRNRFFQLLNEIEHLDWDLVYVGRKILLDDEEEFVTEHTTKPLYSYWTLGYLISERGARKLLDAKPLDKMLPVDEFLPIMFDQHPNDTWKAHFPVRNLLAYSAAPLLVHPTHYTGQDGYISDTEDSDVVEIHPPHRITNELLDSVLEELSAVVERPMLPCASQRTALQLCYTSHNTQPLKCQHLVNELIKCARNHAQSLQLKTRNEA